MAEKITLDELVTKRIRLTQKEYSELMFHLDTCVNVYEILKRNNPHYDECSCEYEDEFREIDYLDFGSLVIWGRTMMYNCNKIVRKAHAAKNIIGDKKGHPHVFYSREEGLRERADDGTIYKADPIGLMM